MVTLILNKTWIHLASSGETEFVSGLRDPAESDTRSVTGRVSQYLGGRQRGITQQGVASVWPFTMRGVLGSDTDKLASWMSQGAAVLVRDNRGRRMYGILLAVPRTPWKEQLDLYDVEVAVNGVDVVEDV